jgi:hypothetical protein
MKRPAASAIVVFVVVVVVAGAIVAALTAGTNGAPAVEVGDRHVSRESVNDELRAIADNKDLAQAAGESALSSSPGTVRADAGTGLVLTGVLQEALILEYLDRHGERVTDDDRTEGKALRPDTTVGQFYAGFPKWYRDRYDERLASYVALARVRGVDLSDQDVASEINPVLQRTGDRAGVRVDPRYGRYARGIVQVVPFEVTAADIARANASG